MPSIYTHEAFGKAVLHQLPEEMKETIHEYPNLYQIGLQGPDVLFFYQPFKKNRTNSTGINMHSQSLLQWLIPATRMIYNKGKDTPEYSYYLGFILHYLLDSKCHPYINSMVKELRFNHIELETEFDRYLLTKRGHDPLHYPVYKLVPTDLGTALGISSLYRSYPGITTTAIYRSMKDMYFYKMILFAPSRRRRKVLERFCKAFGIYSMAQGHIMHTRINPKSDITNPHLLQLVREQIPEAVDILTQIDALFDLEETECLSEIVKLTRLHLNFKGELI
jgi:hypothetical protein